MDAVRALRCALPLLVLVLSCSKETWRPATPAAPGRPPRPAASMPRLVVQSGHANTVTSARFSPDGSILASVGADRSLRVWDSSTGALRAMGSEFNGGGWLNDLAFHPSGKWIFTIGDDNYLRVWDVSSLRVVKEISFSDSPLSIAVSPPAGLHHAGVLKAH